MQLHTITITEWCEIGYKGLFGTNLSEPIRLLPNDYFTELKNGWWRLTQLKKPAWKESNAFEIEFSHKEMSEFCNVNVGYFKEKESSQQLFTAGYTGSCYE